VSWERLGTPRFSAARFQKREKLQSGSRGRKNHLPRDNTREHRGVSASSFRDGAILRELGTPTFKLACLEKTRTPKDGTEPHKQDINSTRKKKLTHKPRKPSDTKKSQGNG